MSVDLQPRRLRISDSFLSSDEYAERAHRLYSDARYDDALQVLRHGLDIFPAAAELHVGMGYARLARDEFAWARQSFVEALALESTNEDALAGLGEVLLKLGRRSEAGQCFDAVLALGFREDHDLMLQVGRALFREGVFDRAREFFELLLVAHPDSSEAAASLGFTAHRLGDDDSAVRWLRRALDADPADAESRIYLGNVLYDSGDYDGALQHFERTHPADHLEELALWRYIELKKSMYRVDTRAPDLRPWISRLHELTAAVDADERLLAEIEATLPDGTYLDPHQLDFFGTHLTQLRGMQVRRTHETHDVMMSDGSCYSGTWEQIVLQILRDDEAWTGGSLAEYMQHTAQRYARQSGMPVSSRDAESFIRGIAGVGALKITT